MLTRVYVKDDNWQKQPKFVVFLPQLMELFGNCPTFYMPGVLIEITKFGTMVEQHATIASARNVAMCGQANQESKCPIPIFQLETHCCHFLF